ncbi:MAG: NUDIX hydrolase [Dissulfurispiraceae bacterium]
MIEVVNSEGLTIGVRRRSEVHDNPSLLHKVVHILVFNDAGNLLLQKRSMHKDVAPGKWDTSVGGHVSPGENLNKAAMREMQEELGTVPENITPLYSYIYSDSHESELVFTYKCRGNGPFKFNRQEIDEIAFWKIDDIRQSIGSGVFSGHFEDEIMNYFSLQQEDTD